MHRIAELDHCYLWHPFTQMRDWLRCEPIVIRSGQGAILRDIHGRQYLDANASIWTNLHGHNHPAINTAIQRQLKKIAHSSALGLANEPAAILGERLVKAANASAFLRTRRPRPIVNRKLAKVFFSDDGSTAMEVALKLAFQFARRAGLSRKPRFVSLGGAYHGDTLGAVAAGHIDLFHKSYADLLFKTDKVAAPYCYRCRFNRAKPERADARDSRKCHWECLGVVEQKFVRQRKRGNPYAGFVFEPLIQGAAGMIPQPKGWLSQATEVARTYGALLIADEVMTGFGRSGAGSTPPHAAPGPLFACQSETVQPDLMAVAKGLTGGYLPMAATLTTQVIFDAFLGDYREFRTFFHGHSYTANQLGAAAGLASLDLLKRGASIRARRALERNLGQALSGLWGLDHVGDIRQVGLIAGVELVRNWRTREPFALEERAGLRVCDAMARRGVLTRPIGNVIVLMPPYCSTADQVAEMVTALGFAIRTQLGV